MDDTIRSIYQGYVNAFKAYNVNDPQTQAEIDQWIQELEQLANSSNDITAFYTKFNETLMESYTGLMSKLARAEVSAKEGSTTGEIDVSKRRIPTVKEFIAQYEIPYNEIKKAGYRKRGEKAYENLFAVADRTSDIVEAQIIMEEEGLLWKLVTEDSLDIFETILQAMDSLNPTISKPLQLHVDVYKQAKCDPELNYRLELLEPQKTKIRELGNIKIILMSHLAKYLLEYCKARMIIWDWPKDQLVQGALKSLLNQKEAIKKTLTQIKDILGLSFEEVLKDEGLKIWLLSPQSVDELGRIKRAMLPQNYDAFKDIIDNEINAPIQEVLLRKPNHFISFLLTQGHDRFADEAAKLASELNASLTYFQYKEQLESQARAVVPELAKKKSPVSSILSSVKNINPSVSTSSQVQASTSAYSPVEDVKNLFKGFFGKK